MNSKLEIEKLMAIKRLSFCSDSMENWSLIGQGPIKLRYEKKDFYKLYRKVNKMVIPSN